MSHIVIDRKTGKPVLEIFSQRVADAINRERYEVVTALEWLHRFNEEVRAQDALLRQATALGPAG